MAPGQGGTHGAGLGSFIPTTCVRYLVTLSSSNAGSFCHHASCINAVFWHSTHLPSLGRLLCPSAIQLGKVSFSSYCIVSTLRENYDVIICSSRVLRCASHLGQDHTTTLVVAVPIQYI